MTRIGKSISTTILLSSFVALSSCGSGGSGGAVDDGSSVDTSSQDISDAMDPEDLVSDDQVENLQFLNSGESLSGSLTEGEFVTFLVPEDSQVVVTSNSGDSDVFLFDSLEFADETFVCAERTAFAEDICSGSSESSDFLFATVAGNEITNDYTVSVTDDCSVGNINQWVYRSMQDYYLFADQVPVVNPLDYDSPSDLVADLRFNVVEPFSGIRDAVGQQLLFDEGKDFGFGYRWGRDENNDLRILNVAIDSPFGRAGVKRGDIFHSLGGILDEDLTDAQFFDFIGTDDDPNVVEWGFLDGVSGELETFLAAKAEHEVNTVSFTGSYTHPQFSGRTGYIVFNQFLNTSVEELDASINQLIDEDITELVLDLRYNGGGRVFVAERLAAQISGSRFTGEVLSRTRYNDTYSHLDSEREYDDAEPSLDLSRVIVLTTERTASASELVINALSPYLDVVTIGSPTTGKPFQSFARDFCGMSLNAMNSQLVNVADTSVAGGIVTQCFAQDDRTRNYGIGENGIELMLKSALDFIVFGTCEVNPSDTILARTGTATSQRAWEKTGDFDSPATLQNEKPWPFVKGAE